MTYIAEIYFPLIKVKAERLLISNCLKDVDTATGDL